MTYDVARLVRDLSTELRGEVRDDTLSKAMYATDASNYRVVPDLVVLPRDESDLLATLDLARAAGAPVAMRGAGTSMAGNALGGVVVDVSRHLDRIVDIDPAAATATVQPGVVLTDLVAAVRPHGLTFGADPSSASRCTLGGMIANNACGAHSVAWGTTGDNVRALRVVTADGRQARVQAVTDTSPAGPPDPAIADLHRALARLGEEEAMLIRRRFGTFSRQISGYALQHLLPERGVDLARLLCGSEGTLATTLEATVSLATLPRTVVLLALGFPDAVSAARSVPTVLPHGPLTMESINATLVERLPADTRRAATAAGLPPGQMWLLVEVGADDEAGARSAAADIAQEVRDAIPGATASVVTDPAAQGVLWRCRRDGTGLATRRADGAEAWAGWEDAAVPPARLGDYLSGLDELMGRYGYSGASYGHFGEGCMHMRIDFDLLSEPGARSYRSFVEQATDLVVSLGGSVSGEHGDGRARGGLLERMYGADATDLFTRVKDLWDPERRLNPRVIVDPPDVVDDLRQQGQAQHFGGRTRLAFAQDAGSFAQAQRRCVGVGKCVQSSGGVMCPSYQVTREETHSTRGRARVLFEMMEGDVITDGWRAEEVRDALDLCLSCKGCLGDCPVNVDMATYKAEFTHQHYRGRPWRRPRSHWTMGWLPALARVAGLAPGLTNRVSGSRLAGPLKRAGGVAQSRDIPEFAPQSFTSWFHREHTPARGQGRTRILLWPDTFTTYLSPEVGKAAVAVLEDAGYEVHLPAGQVCCGLTWVSTGQLGVAATVLRRSLDVIEPALRAGATVVGLEPSCTALFRHEAVELLAGDERAALAKDQVKTLAEALLEAPDWRPRPQDREALVQVHCHQHAVMGFDADREVMRRAGISAQIPDSGCCGLAGNFGFEAGHEDISAQIGERVLAPAVRAAPEATEIVSDGFSCRTQIGSLTPRRGRHLAELLAESLGRG